MELMEVEQALKSVEALRTEVQTLRNQIAMSEKKSNKILSAKEACEYMKVGRPMINLWRETGLVKSIKVGGNGCTCRMIWIHCSSIGTDSISLLNNQSKLRKHKKREKQPTDRKDATLKLNGLWKP